MILRKYTSADKEACIHLFDSNFPKFFDAEERPLFIKWLDHQISENAIYKSPTYTNAEAEAFYVIELPDKRIVGCGGFYIVKDQPEARLAWGMIDGNEHHKGLGNVLFTYRKEMIQKEWPKHVITMGTSQHSYSFYEKMGMKVIATFKDGYGPGIDRIDMEL